MSFTGARSKPSSAAGEAARRVRKSPPRPRRRSFLFAASKAFILICLWGVILGGGVLAYFALTLPDPEKPLPARWKPSIAILAANGTKIATTGDLYGRPLSLGEMSRTLPQAVIATEDRRFYSNFGLDPLGILRAALADLFAGRIVEGGSTITQQLAKILFLSPQRNLARKIREALLALWLDWHFSKNQILEIYLNRVYLGDGAYGIDAAAHRYFGKSAKDLSLYESALIAGLLKAPARYNPFRNRALSAARTRQVLANMVSASFISAAEARAAERAGAGLVKGARRQRGARYFADWVADQIPGFIGPADQDLTVTTTLDPRMQREAESAIASILARFGAKDGVSEGALLALSPDGAIRAMIVGADYDKSQFNRATEAERPPGSAFKPFVYLAGLESGLSPGDDFFDQPIRIGNWSPRDYTRRYLGRVTMAQGLEQSINTVSVEVAEKAGLGHVIALARRLGIDSRLPLHPSIALGADAVNLLELTSAYAPFANGGKGVVPYGITEIRDGKGRILFRRQGSSLGRVIARPYLAPMNAMLGAVLTEGTGKRARLPVPAAGKTGTSEKYRDAWFIGYTADLVAGVWFGNDNDAPMKGVVGGSLPAAAWRRFMVAASRGLPVLPLPGGAPSATPEPSAAARPAGGLLGGFLRLFGAAAPPLPAPGR